MFLSQPIKVILTPMKKHYFGWQEDLFFMDEISSCMLWIMDMDFFILFWFTSLLFLTLGLQDWFIAFGITNTDFWFGIWTPSLLFPNTLYTLRIWDMASFMHACTRIQIIQSPWPVIYRCQNSPTLSLFLCVIGTGLEH